ncbi:MAG: hypothetical protein AB8G14_08885 [Ilumatobacter sp.]
MSVVSVLGQSWKVVLVAVGITMVPAASALATPVLPDPPAPEAPAPEPEVLSDPTSLVQVPAGCPTLPPADVAFVGTVLAKDEFVEKGTVRFQIDQIRAGSASPHAVQGVIDVRYGPDSQFIEVDSQYLVAAAVDDRIGALASKVAPEALLFGGDAVVGLEDTEIDCPLIDDPVMTLNTDGTPIDSSLLSPFFEDRRLLLATIGVPAGIVAAALVALVLLRRVLDAGFRGIFALGRSAVSPSRDHRAARVRRHLTEDELGDEAHLDAVRNDVADDGMPDDGALDDELVEA